MFSETRTSIILGRFLLASFLVLALLWSAPRLMAQSTTASITGFVTDQTGDFVPGAKVMAIHTATGFYRSVISGDDGSYTLSPLPGGTYTLSAELVGFKKYVRTELGPLLAGQVARVDITLQVGQITETEIVLGAPPLLDTQSSAVRTPIYLEQIENLPLNSRNPTELLLLQPGASIALQTTTGPGGLLGFNFNGQNTIGVNYTLDGTDASVVADNALSNSTFNLVTTSVDTIAEFDLGSENYSAEIKGSGGYVNIITKSGTNDFHGSIFEYLRNDKLDARSFFADEREKLRLNDFGFTVSGPIKRDKTFFLANWEGQRIRRPKTGVTTVPTAAFRSTVDPRLQPFLDLTPLPTEPIPGNAELGNFRRTFGQSIRQDLVTARVDHVFSPSDSMYGRYSLNQVSVDGPSGGAALFATSTIFPQISSTTFVRHQLLTLSETHTFSPSVVNTVKVGVDRFREDVRSGPDDPTAFRLPTIGGIPGTSIGGGGIFVGFPHLSLSVKDDLTWIRGKHSLKFGGLYWVALYGRQQFQAFSLLFPSLQDFALNQPSSVFSFFGPTGTLLGNHYSNIQFGLYAQDDIRVTPRFTLNVGLRYDNFGVQKESQNRALNVVDDPLGPFRDPKDPLYDRNNKDFGPRIGFAWQPFDQKRVVIRGGYGVFWGGSGSLEEMVLLQLNLLNTFSITRADNPTLAFPLDLDVLNTIFTQVGRFIIDPKVGDFYSQQWNLTTEYEIFPSTIVRIGYVGNHGVRIPGADEPNAFDPLLGGRPNPNLGTVFLATRQDSTSYNALQVSFRRMSPSFDLNIHYTWSHAVGVLSGAREVTTGIGIGADQIQSLKQRRLSRGNLPFDQRHSLILDYRYEFPRIPGLNRIASAILNDWSMSGIIRVASGLPFNAVTGGNEGAFRFVQRPDIVPGMDPILSGVSPADGFLNPAAFAVPTRVDPATGLVLGNLGNNVLRGRRISTVDWALTKKIQVGERVTIQFTAQFFNLFNHPNFDAPVASLAAGPLFGKSQSVGPPREGQLGLKVIF